MSYDFDKTNELILKSAMKNFTSVGFRNASIRNICRDVDKGSIFIKLREVAANWKM